MPNRLGLISRRHEDHMTHDEKTLLSTFCSLCRKTRVVEQRQGRLQAGEASEASGHHERRES